MLIEFIVVVVYFEFSFLILSSTTALEGK